MTFRERLADWISGGALSEAYEDRNDAQHYENKNFAAAEHLSTKVSKYDAAIRDIMRATADGKSGTAQKIYRMAKEALGE